MRWQRLVDVVAEGAGGGGISSAVATGTIRNTRYRFDRLASEQGVAHAFEFLVMLSVSARDPEPKVFLSRLAGVQVRDASPLGLTIACRNRLDESNLLTEDSQIAARAVASALATFETSKVAQGESLLEEKDEWQNWRSAARGDGFCELSRLFVSSLTETYVRLFMDREAVTSTQNLAELTNFRQSLAEHFDSVSRHAFETSKITQSFAAGWFNKHASDRMPSQEQIQGFLRVVLAKVSEELRREGSDAGS